MQGSNEKVRVWILNLNFQFESVDILIRRLSYPLLFPIRQLGIQALSSVY